MRILITFCLLALFAFPQLHAATVDDITTCSSFGPAITRPLGPTTGPARIPFPLALPLGNDIKRLEIPTRIPKEVKKRIDPNFREFLLQLDK